MILLVFSYFFNIRDFGYVGKQLDSDNKIRKAWIFSHEVKLFKAGLL